MGHLFYTELGNLGYIDTNGNYNDDQDIMGLHNTGDFNNLFGGWYMFGQEEHRFKWVFNMYDGEQNDQTDVARYHTGWGLAVRTGQVSAVPVPGG